MTRFFLEPRFKFIGQHSASQKPVQSLATLLRATDPNACRSMPQIDPGAPEEALIEVLF
ncbi:MAG TPA: hypothetical protein VGF37_11555 [Chthoniobacterales bacterium]